MKQKRPSDGIDSLLPWYVTGTLNEAETDRMADDLAALENASTLVDDETRLLRHVAGKVPDLDKLLDRKAAAFEQLQARLTVESNSAAGQHLRSRRNRSWAAALSVTLIVCGASLTWLLSGGDRTEYATRTDSTSLTPGTGIQVAVAPRTTPAQIQRLTDRLNAAIVSGPSRHNVYLIAVPEGSDVAHDLAWLRTQPEVTFAEAEIR